MSYIALARQWRPRTFSKLIGQNHITKALTNSLNQNRLHHAYLFTGTRGVGKTSIARLLAKALNCEKGISANPCLECDACLAIEQGRFLDLIEIDGASRTRVEDTREILENVQYAPTHARFKIYLIDEVHMLSQHSFNALLKTLEEPPAHVKFILATTDPQKLPITVLSRCLQFHLKPLDPAVIGEQLEHILKDEHISYEKEAVELLAKAARGSMRDALSLLDQAIAGSDQCMSLRDVRNSLGYAQQDYALQLLQTLADSNPHKLMEITQQIGAEGGAFEYVLEDILTYLHQISVKQALAHDHELIQIDPELSPLASHFSPEDIQLFYQIGLKGSQDLHLAPTLSIGFEMLLLRMYTFRPKALAPMPPLLHNSNEDTIEHPLTPKAPPRVGEEPNSVTALPMDDHAKLCTDSDSETGITDWGTIIPHLKLSGLALNAAENAEFVSKSGSTVVLRVAKGHQSVFTSPVMKRIEQGLTNYYKSVVKLTIQSDEPVLSSPAQERTKTQQKKHEQAEAALQNDSFFQQLQHEFSAEVVKNSIAPLKDDL